MSVAYRKRTIHMPETRANQIALAAAELGVSSEQFIQSALTAALITVAEHDDRLAFMLARANWNDLKALAKATAERERIR